MDTPQNRPKIKHTHTRAHQQRQREHCCKLVAVGWCLEVDWNESRCLWRRSEFLDRLERISMDRCLWQRRCLWIGACDREGEASFIHGGSGVFKNGERESFQMR